MPTTEDFFAALRAGDLDALRGALRDAPELADARDAHGVSPVLLALYHGHADAARLVAGARDVLDLHEAAALGEDARVAERLASSASEVDVRSPDGFTPLQLACFFGHADVVDRLLSAGADANAVAANDSRVQPLHSTVPGLHRACAGRLLAAGAEVDARQAGGWTPLMAAAKRGDAEFVALLLDGGADPAAAADDGSTARELATGAAQAALVQDR